MRASANKWHSALLFPLPPSKQVGPAFGGPNCLGNCFPPLFCEPDQKVLFVVAQSACSGPTDEHHSPFQVNLQANQCHNNDETNSQRNQHGNHHHNIEVFFLNPKKCAQAYQGRNTNAQPDQQPPELVKNRRNVLCQFFVFQIVFDVLV
eukprot:TRINITY_DN22359_c0_g2_i1.p2 TRINITY_DN22359_c0_g2~~TRINITY_DN22359_c0_g2_i1.p2  ORF type:complete len:149 (-),score=7.10 TRINITY_DN22359_c0_g2_i1:170-616(-)